MKRLATMTKAVAVGEGEEVLVKLVPQTQQQQQQQTQQQQLIEMCGTSTFATMLDSLNMLKQCTSLQRKSGLKLVQSSSLPPHSSSCSCIFGTRRASYGHALLLPAAY